MTFGDILIVSAAVAVLGYILGDLFFVPSYGNIAATIADLVLAWITIYVFNFIWAARAIDFIDALVAAVAIAAGEWFFHMFIEKRVIGQGKQQ